MKELQFINGGVIRRKLIMTREKERKNNGFVFLFLYVILCV